MKTYLGDKVYVYWDGLHFVFPSLKHSAVHPMKNLLAKIVDRNINWVWIGVFFSNPILAQKKNGRSNNRLFGCASFLFQP